MNEFKEWINKCINRPDKYKIYVDNDDVYVVDKTETNEDDQVVYTFDCYGYDFIVKILDHLGIDVDYV